MDTRFKPKRISEANIQAELYHQCRLAGVNAFLEYAGKWNAVPRVRFDVVIHDNHTIRVLVECKSTTRPKRRQKKWIKTRQAERYRAAQLPTLLCCCMADVPPAIETIKQILKMPQKAVPSMPFPVGEIKRGDVVVP